MSDETFPSDHELASAAVASAYVDGQATAQERARVDASPELLALVDTYRSMRTALQAVPAPQAAARDAALAAALSAFDVVSVTSPQVTTTAPVAPQRPNVVSLERHRRASRVLAAAAAVAIVGVAGVALAGMFGGSDNDSASTGTVLSADGNTESLGSSKVGVAGFPDTDATGDVATDASVSDSIDPESSPNVTGSETKPTETIGSINGGASPVPEFRDTAALQAVPEPTSRVAPSFEFDCPLDSTQEVLLEITWRGTPALVVRDTVTRLITVLDAQCTALVSVQP